MSLIDLTDTKKTIKPIKPPHWHELTLEQQLEFTMSGTIPVYDWYIDDSVSKSTNWTDEYVESFIERFTKFNIEHGLHGEEPYGNGSLWHLQALEKYNIKDKKIAVIGSLTPWIEVIAMLCGNIDITTVEYNTPRPNKYIKTISYDDFVNSSEKFDVIISYSSIEHSGLTRYSDPINPVGDLDTMTVIHEKLIDNGILFLGVPVGQDCITWNAHRVYGYKRFSLLLKDFDEIEWMGVSKSFLDNCGPSNNGPQPVIVLTKK